MIVETAEQLATLKEIGRICAKVLHDMMEATRPGITTKELDELGGEILKKYGAISGPIGCYNFPGYTCISVNEEIAHGIPGPRVIKEGDMVNIDVSASLDGIFADTASSFFVGKGDKKGEHILKVSRMALNNAINAAVAGKKLNVIGKAVEQTARKNGCFLIENLCGHGVGNTLHDEPSTILNYYDPSENRRLEKGMVIAIEPFISEKEHYVEQDEEDGWTLRCPGWTRAAQCEHTIMVTDKRPIIITKYQPE